MFAGLSHLRNRTTRKQIADLLTETTAQLRQSVEANARSLELCGQLSKLSQSQASQLLEAQAEFSRMLGICKKWSELFDEQALELADSRGENARLWISLGVPGGLQPFVAMGFTEVEARRLAEQAKKEIAS
jgi:superfamily II RNA helicase